MVLQSKPKMKKLPKLNVRDGRTVDGIGLEPLAHSRAVTKKGKGLIYVKRMRRIVDYKRKHH